MNIMCCIYFASRRYQYAGSQEIFSREWIIVLRVCFFDSCFKKHILSGNLVSLLFIFQGVLINWNNLTNAVTFKTSKVAFLIVLARTDRIWLRKGEKHFNLCGHNLFRYLNSRLLRRGNLKTNVSLWKRIKCFLSTLRRRNLKKQQSPVNFDFCLRKTWWGKSTPTFSRVFKCFPSTKSRLFQIPPVWRLLSKRLHFRDRLVWMVGLTV